jgi:starch phosphorylase
MTLSVAQAYEGGRMRYEGTVTLDRSGPFGYTVRVLPSHRLLAGPAELGLVALPSGGPVAAPDNGFLLR